MYQEITEKKRHAHTIYNSLHLNRHDKKELNKMIKERPNITAAAAIAGIDPSTGAITKSVREINNIMANHGQTKYEIQRSKIQQDLYTTKEDTVVTSEDLDNQPIITDVTFKAVPKGYYLCSSVIYIKQLQKHVVFYQAIIKINSVQTFKQYFVDLIKKFNVKLEKFLGVVMDFSAAQQKGFILALKEVFGVKQHNALPFLEGCYMHRIQSVKRLSNNYQVVKPDEIDIFLKLIHRLGTTASSIVFFRTGKELLTKFPNCKKWLQWWLQPGVSSMVFRCKSLMKKELREHKSRTSSAIETFHNALYKLIPKRQPVATSLRLLLQVAKRDGMMLMHFYDNNIRPYYGKKSKKYPTLYEINDGRAPDNNTALFGTKKRKQEVVVIGDETYKRQKTNKSASRDAGLDTAINDHFKEIDEVVKDFPQIDNIADDITGERLFLELLSDDESDEADGEYVRTEDLEDDVKNLFKDLDISVEDVADSNENSELSVIDFVSSSSSLIKSKSDPTSVAQHKSELASSKTSLPSAAVTVLSSPPKLFEDESLTTGGFRLPQKRASLLHLSEMTFFHLSTWSRPPSSRN